MTNKEKIINKIVDVKACLDSGEITIPDNLITKLLDIKNEVNNFKFYLPLIGNFNAGKSSLINSYLKNDELLSTNIVPETALATEIYYDTNERIEVYKFDNQSPIKIIDSLNFSNIDTNISDYLKVYINSEILKEQNIVIVDMPGLDSNLQRHNQSIFNYMTKEVSFLLLLNAEDGTVRESTLEFLKEVKDYRLDFFTILNKIDKLIPSEIEKVYSYIHKQVSQIVENPFVGKVSAITDEIDDFKNLINNIDVDKSIQKLFDEKTNEAIEAIISDLEIRKDTLSLDTEEIDEKISTLLKNMREMDKELQNEKRNVENKFSYTLLSEVLSDVENSLRTNLDSLIQAVEISNEYFNSRVNEIIRPVIISKIKNYSETIFADTIKNLNVKSNDIFSDINNLTGSANKVLTATTQISKVLPTLVPVLATVLTKLNPIVFAITTVVSIISSLFSGAKQSSEVDEKAIRSAKIRDDLINRIIPSIPSQISSGIQNSIEKMKDEFFLEIEERFKEKVNEIENSLQIAKFEKENKKSELESQKQKYNNLINQLKDL